MIDYWPTDFDKNTLVRFGGSTLFNEKVRSKFLVHHFRFLTTGSLATTFHAQLSLRYDHSSTAAFRTNAPFPQVLTGTIHQGGSLGGRGGAPRLPGDELGPEYPKIHHVYRGCYALLILHIHMFKKTICPKLFQIYALYILLTLY